jgi:hypothetical protein
MIDFATTPSPVREMRWQRPPDAMACSLAPGWYTATATINGPAGFRVVDADGNVLGTFTRARRSMMTEASAGFVFYVSDVPVFTEYACDADGRGYVSCACVSVGLPFGEFGSIAHDVGAGGPPG